MLCSKLNENRAIQDFILNSPAPIYTACKLARLYREESTREKDKAQDFLNMGNYCEEMSRELLHLATTFNRDDVLNAVDGAGQPLLDIMIDDELKHCVSHPNVQGYLSEVWKGDASLFVGWKSVVFFFACLFVPPIWAIFCLPFHRYSHVPTLKFICHVVSQLYLVLLLTVVAADPLPGRSSFVLPTAWEWLLLIFLAGILLSQIKDPHSSGGYLLSVVLVLSIVAIFVHIVAIFFDGSVQKEIVYGRDQILGCCLLLCVVQFMEYLSLHHLFGPWSIIIRSLILDLLRFLVILFIFIIGFVLHLSVVYKPVYEVSSEIKYFYDNLMRLFYRLFFAMFGQTDLKDIEKIDITINPPVTRYIALLVFALYEIITIIVLINLLIAMMSNTYTRLEERSDIEWKFGRAKLIRSISRSRSTPVPFNIMTAVLVLCRIIRDTRCRCCAEQLHHMYDEIEHKLTDNMEMVSYVGGRPVSAFLEQGSGAPKRLETVVNWNDVVRRYIENKGVADDEDDYDDDDQEGCAFSVDQGRPRGGSRTQLIAKEMRYKKTLRRVSNRLQREIPNGHIANV